ncbi:CYTH and CHAD domain-containing protein [Microbispora sp. NBRC 16548]|uniref:CYTH and CHAD domain-containing protein n=1 Tax=Microbispora sp. NBRC 16548 TaxID=3030994 RepID=UPI00249FB06C|nr:CYTH and CHAD domain-containing protein [Microbispora sp. NBRC 16548]GLX08732.1 CHAD domain-containing protein [Microbispora sp. NBRC 16548]
MALEIEDKFDVPEGFALPDLGGVPGCEGVSEPLSHRLTAVYFDTPDLRLAARGVTLRRRRGGDDEGWHLKLPKAKGARQEITRPLTRSAKVVPAELASLVLAYTRGAPLAPVAQLETRRGITRLLGPAGTVLVEIADDRVKGTVLGDEPVVRRWREVEAELKEGERDLLKKVAKRLRKAGAAPADSASKLARVLGDRIPAPPPRTRPEPDSAGEVVVAYLRAHADALIAQDPHVRLGEEDAVHKARVACRRLRSALKAFKRIVVGTEHIQGDLQEELKWLGEVLGEARDLEVIRARFATRLDGLDPRFVTADARRRLGDDLLAREHDAYERIRRALSEDRYFALLDALDALAADPPLTATAAKNADKALPKIVDRNWRRVTDAYEAARCMEEGEERETAMHDVRKAAKRARYTAEAAGMSGAAERAKQVQEVLGRHQDGVVAQGVLLEEAGRARQAGEDTFTYGVLAGIESAEAARAQEEFPAVWSRLA